jgi:hypothetical protein
MTKQEGEQGRREVNYDELAKNIFCGWLAYRLGVTLPTAKRNIEKSLEASGKNLPREGMWHHVAEYVEKLHMGYLPFDLSAMRLDESKDLDELEEGTEWLQ